MWKWSQILGIALVLSIAASQQKRYDGYQVYRITPTNEEQVEKLRELEQNHSYDFWKPASRVNEPADVMVSPKRLPNFLKIIQENNFHTEVTIKDVQSVINAEKSSGNLRASYEWSSYPSLDQIYAWVDSLPARFGNIVTIITVGSSYQGRPLIGVRIAFPQNSSRRAIFLEGGIHAREWISPVTVMYLLDRILSETDPQVRAVIERYDYYIFPLLNPDGYKYSQEIDRLWRKNRQPWTKLPILQRFCLGTDLNRNWGYHWRQGNGSSTNPCNERYSGPGEFSAPESKSISNFIITIQSKLAAYLTFHSYGQYILLPYGDSNTPSENAIEAYDVAKAAANALKKKYGTEYQVGTDIQLLKYYTNGVSSDWVKYYYKTPIVLSFELRPSSSNQNAFMLPPAQILPTGRETFDALVAIVQETASRGYV